MTPPVNHAHPLHDHLCRCRACKPSPVGATSQSWLRFRVGMMVAGVGTVAMMMMKGVGA